MTIELQTGLPGACKTQYTLWRIEALRKQTGRPVFYSGIPIDPEKLPDWQPIDARDWHTCPPESIVVIDEAQRLFRPRPNGSAVPPYEEALETHRHGGIDLVLITQKPRLISIGVRELVGRHLHAVRSFGMQRATIHEWAECRLNTGARSDSIKHQFKFKPHVFGWYKSAQAHTVKREIPARVWLLLALPLVLLALSFWTWRFLEARKGNTPAPTVSAAPGQAPTPSVAAPAPLGRGEHLTPRDYLASYAARIPGLAFTAPAYDEVTKPVRAPYPAACVANTTRCQCYTQQATPLDVPWGLCRRLVRGGFFMAWDEKQPERLARAEVEDKRTPPPLEGGSFISLGGRPNGPIGGTEAQDKETGQGVARARGQNGARPPNGGGGYGS